MVDEIQVAAAVEALENRIKELDVELAALQYRKDRLCDALSCVKEQFPELPEEYVARVSIGYTLVPSMTDSSKGYAVEAFRVKGGAVITCTCPAFKYTEGDQWKGDRVWCKHITQARYGSDPTLRIILRNENLLFAVRS